MSTAKHLRNAIAIAALSIVAVSPALAQGNGRGKEKDRQEAVRAERAQRQRPTLQRRGEAGTVLRPSSGDRYEDRSDDRYEDRSDDRYEERGVENRRRGASWEDILYGRDDDRRTRRRDVPPGWCKGRGNPHNTPENCGYSSDRRYDWEDNDRYGGYGSYADAHRAFHRALDREYAARAAERRTDPLYQIRLRAEKSADHERWHERTGTRH
jgi:hypothetical protein